MTIPPLSTATRGVAASCVCATFLLAPTVHADGGGDSCPKIYEKGTLSLDFNPAFLEVDEYDDGEGLAISSFFNVQDNSGPPPAVFFERDLVARIPQVGDIDYADPGELTTPNVEELTDLNPGPPKTVWPNEVARVPDGVFPFEAIMLPQGFLSAGRAGRLTAIDLATKTEYLIHQSTYLMFVPPGPGNEPRFYHRVVYIDMDDDGLEDLVTVRSGFMPGPITHPPTGELVWFRNPGDDLDPSVPWEETVLLGGFGPDIDLDAKDLDGDGIEEIVATHFFTGDTTPGPFPTKGKISIYGPQAGMRWSSISDEYPLRAADISTDQGYPFGVKIVDLDANPKKKKGKRKYEILATNHQPDGCAPFPPTLPGRVYALEQPESGDLFGDAWTTHILLDDIRPQPSLAGTQGLGRLAPGHALTFFPKRKYAKKKGKKPWIVVGGDEAGKVWVLEPVKGKDNRFEYITHIVFDINDYYGVPDTTQTVIEDQPGITISTIGRLGVRYDEDGYAELYIPIFEGKRIHVLSFNKHLKHCNPRVECLDDVMLQCPPPAPGGPPAGGPPAGGPPTGGPPAGGPPAGGPPAGGPPVGGPPAG